MFFFAWTFKKILCYKNILVHFPFLRSKTTCFSLAIHVLEILWWSLFLWRMSYEVIKIIALTYPEKKNLTLGSKDPMFLFLFYSSLFGRSQVWKYLDELRVYCSKLILYITSYWGYISLSWYENICLLTTISLKFQWGSC